MKEPKRTRKRKSTSLYFDLPYFDPFQPPRYIDDIVNGCLSAYLEKMEGRGHKNHKSRNYVNRAILLELVATNDDISANYIMEELGLGRSASYRYMEVLKTIHLFTERHKARYEAEEVEPDERFKSSESTYCQPRVEHEGRTWTLRELSAHLGLAYELLRFHIETCDMRLEDALAR
ncbi:hypothetical protein [Vibrio breoganii]|uniref:hypothetical protein n=1 Tax=Vibrio breoganii TaxID=553239 RepID=UPI000C825B5E|nr:hypothetical protein [Vibrio breoganii]PMM26362.1 hypothetical protein BCT59_02655 [Vibrio breoganii]